MAEPVEMSPDGVLSFAERFARQCSDIAESARIHRDRIQGMERFAADRLGTAFSRNYGSSAPVFDSGVQLGEWGLQIGMAGKRWAELAEQVESDNRSRVTGTET